MINKHIFINAKVCYSVLMWLMPLLVILFAVLEYVMFILYNEQGHPWKDILNAALEVGNINLF